MGCLQPSRPSPLKSARSKFQVHLPPRTPAHVAQADPLLFRRQFLLGPIDSIGLQGWRRQRVTEDHHLSVHPDLELTHVSDGEKSLTLLGFILDPENPSQDNTGILQELLHEDWKNGNPAMLTARFGGRWAMVVHDRTRTIIFHDATGMRQVYYGTTIVEGQVHVYCGSQPGLIAETLKLSLDAEAVDYIRSKGNNDLEVYWIPGHSSQYSQIRALLPNHLLDLKTGTTLRYWPTEKLEPVVYQHAVDEGLRQLRGLMTSARRRYALAIAMTAGWDSRLMLALTAEFAAQVHFFTLVYPGSGKDSRDVRVPNRLLKRLKLKHHLIGYPKRIDDSFRNILKRNSSSIHVAYCADAQAMHDLYPSDRVCVTGDVAEIVKNYHGNSNPGTDNISACDLARLSKIGDHPFGIAALQSWISSVVNSHGIGILNLFCWEQMAGRWQAHIRSEYDIVQESFAPLNCRNLLVVLLGANESHRSAPGFELFRQIIQNSWSEVLAVPINPPERASLKQSIITWLGAVGVYQVIPQAAKDFMRRVVRKVA